MINTTQVADFQQFLKTFTSGKGAKTTQTTAEYGGYKIPVYINEFWTAGQRQANSIHEVAYRACFKPQLPGFFIGLLTAPGDTVYDPFNGRGTTVIEASLQGRNIIANDINPVSLMLTRPRIAISSFGDIEQRLNQIPFEKSAKAGIDLSMFYHRATLAELVSLKEYLHRRKEENTEDDADRWLRMVATNRLTGHSPGFFSVYTLPPNQATSAERQKKINLLRKQVPEYRDVKKLILKKSASLLKDMQQNLFQSYSAIKAQYLNSAASGTPQIKNGSVALTVTSPPFLDVVQYARDNWLRCWFNGIEPTEVEKKITMSRTVGEWTAYMQKVFDELYRITRPGGWLAFEVGEVRKGKIKLEDAVVPLGIKSGFECCAVMLHQQDFTKTANIWGVSNNMAGTNTHRIAVFRKS